MGWRSDKEARLQTSSITVKIISISRGHCDVQTPRGVIIRRVHFAQGFFWPINSWVKIERVGTDWQVIGNGPSVSEVFVPEVIIPPLVPGQWDQAWANFLRNGYGVSTADPANWPGDEILSWATDLNGLSPYPEIAQPIGLVYHPTGRVLLLHQMTDQDTLHSNTVAFIRMLVLSPQFGATPWVVDATVDIPLPDDKDRQFQEWGPDGNVFYSPATKFLTVFARIGSTIPGAAADTDLANYWNIDLTDPLSPVVHAGLSVKICEDAALRRAANCMNVADNYMAKLNMSEHRLYTYKRNSDKEFELKAEIDWAADLAALFPTYDTTSGIMTPSYYSFPFVNNGIINFWTALSHISNYNGSITPNSDRGQLLELRILPDGGGIADTIALWAQELPGTRGTIARCATALTEAAAAVLGLFPGLDSYSSTTPLTGFCGLNPVSYDRVDHHVWTGPIYEDYAYTLGENLGSGIRQAYWPGVGTSPSGSDVKTYDDDNPIGVGSPGVLPSQQPNLEARGTARFGWGGVNNYARYVASPSGWRYCAILAPVPFLIPDGTNFIQQTFNTLGYTQYGGPCWFITDRWTFAGILPLIFIAGELTFVGVSPANVVSSMVPFARFAGVFGETGAPPEESMPLADNCYQPMPIELLDRVFWLHDWREVKDDDPAPRISVTNMALTGGILWQVNIADLIPIGCIEKFVGDQVYHDPVEGDITWALDGEFKFRLHNVNGEGPLMKSFKKGNDFYLVVGLEFVERVEPNTGIPSGGLEASENFAESDSVGGDQVTFNFTDTPVQTVESIYLNGNPGDTLGYSWSLGDDFFVLDNPLVDPDGITVDYHYGAPSVGTAGTTITRTSVIKVTALTYEVVQNSDVTTGWNYPDTIGSTDEGPEAVRMMAVGPDRLVYPTEGPSLRQVM